MKVAVCDDEEYFILIEKSVIENYANEHDFTVEVDCFLTGSDFLNSNLQSYDIAFIDIELRNENGLDVLKIAKEKYSNIRIAFVTNHMKYASKGYEYNLFRYIPKNEKVFIPAMNECLESILKETGYINIPVEIEIKGGECKTVIVGDITYIEGEKHYTNIHNTKLRGGVLVSRMNMDRAEEVFDKFGFIRVHRSFIVNPVFVIRITREGIEMKTGEKVPISQKRYLDILAQYYLFKEMNQ
ncbi:MAG: LytTR family DNA-binding domain-containing protein [Lachnospiraceae bacterium]|nr:LytTR family DNA-binding domain-containing protein [Lachnospiraceae bacterium]